MSWCQECIQASIDPQGLSMTVVTLTSRVLVVRSILLSVEEIVSENFQVSIDGGFIFIQDRQKQVSATYSLNYSLNFFFFSRISLALTQIEFLCPEDHLMKQQSHFVEIILQQKVFQV